MSDIVDIIMLRRSIRQYTGQRYYPKIKTQDTRT